METINQIAASKGLLMYENEDIEGLLVDLGIGYHDQADNYQDGTDPQKIEESILDGEIEASRAENLTSN